MAATSELLTLEADGLEVGLVPAIGGSVSFFRWRGIDLMRPLAADRQDVLGVAMFPMLPYANRIAGNSFRFEGDDYAVQPNNLPERFNVHGSGWQRPWTVERLTSTQVALGLDVAAGPEPYAYRARQVFSLDPGGLTVTMTLTNVGDKTLPFGFGLHPWFERTDDVTLQFNARRFYLEEPEGLSGDPVTLPPELDFSAARSLPTGWRNNDYGGWDGVATVCYPGRGAGLRITADPVFRHLMVYADPTKPYFCVEPQSNASGAFNRGLWQDAEEGVITLAPGASATGSISFAPFAL